MPSISTKSLKFMFFPPKIWHKMVKISKYHKPDFLQSIFSENIDIYVLENPYIEKSDLWHFKKNEFSTKVDSQKSGAGRFRSIVSILTLSWIFWDQIMFWCWNFTWEIFKIIPNSVFSSCFAPNMFFWTQTLQKLK